MSFAVRKYDRYPPMRFSLPGEGDVSWECVMVKRRAAQQAATSPGMKALRGGGT